MEDRQGPYEGKGVVGRLGNATGQLFPTIEPQEDSGAGSTKDL